MTSAVQIQPIQTPYGPAKMPQEAVEKIKVLEEKVGEIVETKLNASDLLVRALDEKFEDFEIIRDEELRNLATRLGVSMKMLLSALRRLGVVFRYRLNSRDVVYVLIKDIDTEELFAVALAHVEWKKKNAGGEE
ncbi:hypothetical protein P8X24_07465 [Pyrococcus kukulkanii]|uniref:hypothetical protein n=1 Tax=Pyrococcus kukulkanii TaxID=1609559 RepID=UPI0035686E2A